MAQDDFKGSRTLSKKKFYELQEALQQKYGDEQANDVLDVFKKVLKFDPNVSVYTENMKKCIMQRREKLKEQGIPPYVSSGAKAFYDKKFGRVQCQNYLCESTGYEGYKNYCPRCFVNLFPHEVITKRFKSKESVVIQYLKEHFGDKITSLDKKIEGGCSRYRPDVFIDCLTHSIIAEIDENQHDSYDCTCENKRLMTLFQDLGDRPLVMIRFNPDDYKTREGKSIPSCFIYKNKNGLPSIKNKYDWGKRLEVLKETIERHIGNIPSQEVTIEHLFYDRFV